MKSRVGLMSFGIMVCPENKGQVKSLADNSIVGGDILELALDNAKIGGQVVLCGGKPV